jgi:hypothetical protein
VRRTTNHDAVRPDGFFGPLLVTARGRDLLTIGDGAGQVVDEVTLAARVDVADGQRVAELRTDPPEPRLARLVGIPAGGGFRRELVAALPVDGNDATLRFQLLDDLPTVTLVSGHAIVSAAPVELEGRPRGALAFGANQCAGWVDGGTIMLEVDRGNMPPIVVGPEALALERDDDPLAWHAVPELPPRSTRRRRRIDVWPGTDGDDVDDLDDLDGTDGTDGTVHVDAFFRDSHRDGDGFEEVVHEYSVRATVDRATGEVLACTAAIGALPFVECVGAAASASTLVGVDVRDLRGWVRRELHGPPTCTHLNDTLRALADVPALLAHLPA